MKGGESEGCCVFVLFKMEDVEGEEHQNAMFIILADVNSIWSVRLLMTSLTFYNLMEQVKLSLF